MFFTIVLCIAMFFMWILIGAPLARIVVVSLEFGEKDDYFGMGIFTVFWPLAVFILILHLIGKFASFLMRG